MSVTAARHPKIAAALATVAASLAAALAAHPAAAAPSEYNGASANGGRVFFSTADPLANTGDLDNRADVYERFGGVTRVLSTGPAGGNDFQTARFAAASATGTRVFFTTSEALVDEDDDRTSDVYLRESGQTTLVSGGTAELNADLQGLSPDGTTAFFITRESLVPEDADGAFDIYAWSGAATTLVSGGEGVFNFLGSSHDGSRAYLNTTQALDPADSDGRLDIYESSAGTFTWVSTGPASANAAVDPSFSAIVEDRVLFETTERLTPEDDDEGNDVYSWSAGTTDLVSAGSGDQDANFVGAAAGGTRIFFETEEALDAAEDGDSARDVYEATAGGALLVSAVPGAADAETPVFFEAVSETGATAFFSTSEALVAGDTDGAADIYERTGTTVTKVSTSSIGGNAAGKSASFGFAATDASSVFFATTEAMTVDDSDTALDYYVRANGTTQLVTPPPVAGSDAEPQLTGISAGGDAAWFTTTERLLLADDDASEADVYEWRQDGVTLVSTGNSTVQGPAAPGLTATVPGSPASSPTPLVRGAADAGTLVKIYATANCTGIPIGTGSAAQLAGGGIQVTIPEANRNGTTAMRAQATDTDGDMSGCSIAALAYVHDDVAPAAPTLTGSDPESPANENAPQITGSADPGSTVRLYGTNDCTGAAAATGSASQLAAPGLTVNVPDDSTTTFRATATDNAGNTSACSTSAVTYQEATTPPAAPLLTGVSPGSPANENNPRIRGVAAEGATVALYATSDCSGAPAATGSAAELAGEGIAVAVPDDSTRAFRATATLGPNTSGCSPSSVFYREDSTAPATPTLDGSRPRNDNRALIGGSANADVVRVALFSRPSCQGGAIATPVPAQGRFGVALALADNTTLSVWARGFDAAGNASPCSPQPTPYSEDSAAPRSRITFAPGAVTRRRAAQFRFKDITANAGTRFICKLDRRRWRRCKTPVRYKLRPGRHVFRVKAIDLAGNRERGFAKRRFKVVRRR